MTDQTDVTPVSAAKEIPVQAVVDATKQLVAMIPAKSALSSWSIQGISVLVLLELTEIATGDPFSLNGAIKLFLLIAATTRGVTGRTRIKSSPIALTLPGKQAEKLKDTVRVGVETIQALETVTAKK